jgi:hypothetical protein
MRYRAIIVLMVTAAVGTLLVTFPGRLFRDSGKDVQHFSPTFDVISDLPENSEISETRQRAHAAMVRLQMRREARN